MGNLLPTPPQSPNAPGKTIVNVGSSWFVGSSRHVSYGVYVFLFRVFFLFYRCVNRGFVFFFFRTSTPEPKNDHDNHQDYKNFFKKTKGIKLQWVHYTFGVAVVL